MPHFVLKADERVVFEPGDWTRDLTYRLFVFIPTPAVFIVWCVARFVCARV